MTQLDADIQEAEDCGLALLQGLATGPTSSIADLAMLAFAYHAALTAIMHHTGYTAADRVRVIETMAAIGPRARSAAEKWLRDTNQWRGDDT
jgi:hypothetical protein